MVDNTDKEQWINDVLGSTCGMSRAIPGAWLFERVASGLAGAAPVKTRPLPVARWAAAAILLLALNIGSAVYFIDRHNKAVTYAQTNPLAAEMQAESLYNY